MTVDTFLVAHRGQIPDAAWQKRKDEWTYEVSQRGWERTIAEIADGTRDRECVYVAQDAGSGAVLGVAVGRPSDTGGAIGELAALYVSVAHQSTGVGTALLRRVAAHLRELGMRSLHVGVLELNEPARRFYRARGGRIVGHREAGEDGPEVVYGWADSRRLDEL